MPAQVPAPRPLGCFSNTDPRRLGQGMLPPVQLLLKPGRAVFKPQPMLGYQGQTALATVDGQGAAQLARSGGYPVALTGIDWVEILGQVVKRYRSNQNGAADTGSFGDDIEAEIGRASCRERV